MFKINNKVIKVNKVFIVNFEHISHLCSSVSIVNFEHVIAGWELNRPFKVPGALWPKVIFS